MDMIWFPGSSPEESYIEARLNRQALEDIRQIVREEVGRALHPEPSSLPPLPVPRCPDCGGWDLAHHDPAQTRRWAWWCQCPEKWEAHLAQGKKKT